MSMLPSPVVLACGKGRTKSKIGVEHDINKLVAKYKREGMMPRLSIDKGNLVDENGVVVDVTSIGDYQDCCNRIARAEEHFATLPSAVRRHFGNDMFQYTAFVDRLRSEDQDSVRTALALGIIEAKPEPPKPPQPPVNGDPKPADTTVK